MRLRVIVTVTVAGTDTIAGTVVATREWYPRPWSLLGPQFEFWFWSASGTCFRPALASVMSLQCHRAALPRVRARYGRGKGLGYG